MSTSDATLKWTGRFHVAPHTSGAHLSGDKILLPPSALEQLLAAAPVTSSSDALTSTNSTFDPYNPYSFAQERHARTSNAFQQQQLPHPLTFRLVNSRNNRVVFAGIREFSAEEDTAGLSPFLAQALDIGVKHTSRESNGDPTSDDQSAEITVHAKQLPKGTYVKLRPLEAGYNPEDWKSLLEEYMRKNFTTLSKGEVLNVPAGKETYQFLIDGFKPEGDAVCVVDTDLEVDIEALNEEQARETLKRIADRSRTAPGTENGSSKGGPLELFRPQVAQVLEGEDVDYQLPSWDRSSWLQVEISPEDDDDELYLLANPYSGHHRVEPRMDEHVFSDLRPRGPKRLRLSPTNVELEHAEALWIAVHAPETANVDRNPIPNPPKRFTIRASPIDKSEVDSSDSIDTSPLSPNDTICNNCHKPIPSQSLFLHENFCRRNNIPCDKGCGLVFQKSSPSWQTHWHCPHDNYFGNTASSLENHNNIFHLQAPMTCPYTNCNSIADTLPALAHHRTTACPGKLILCQFCHLVVPQEGDPDGVPNGEALLSGLTPHELADGSRTTECHLCARIVRLRDMATHLRNHDHERTSRPRPRICRNANCGRTLDGASRSGDTRSGTRMGQGAGNDIGLCSTCFGPLYVNSYDPEGKMLRRRVERRYLQQLLTGCGKSWCKNEMCVTGRRNVNGKAEPVITKDALPLIRPYVEGLAAGELPLQFCVDEGSQRRRGFAEMMAAEANEKIPGRKVYGFEWCAAALEAESGDLGKAREWLVNFAPSIDEER